MKKRAASFLLALAMLATLAVPAAAVNMRTVGTVIDGGMYHSVALVKNGEVYVWGDNSNGQLGLGAEVTREETPVKVPGVSSVTTVAAGYNFTLALRFNGTVVAWGGSVYQTPTEVAGLERVVAISAGQLSCLALTVDGRVFQWTLGQWPAQVYGIENVVAISAGGNHNLALTRRGEVWTWGNNEKGQLGDGTTNDRATPQKIAELQDIIDIAAGMNHSLAADFNGNVYAWGDNSYGQMGTKEVKGQENLRPMKVSGLKKIVEVAAGNGSCLARNADGQVYSWGYGEFGQTGSGNSEISKSTPDQVSRTGSSVGIACGFHHDLSVSKNGEVYAWGRNNNGQLGTGKNGNANTATKVLSGGTAGAEYETCVLNGISSWAQEEISDLYPKGMIPPTLLNNYQGTITRGELAHLLVAVYEVVKGPVSARNTNKFTDIDSHPMKESILKAYGLGIINGTSESTFSPWGPVSRQEAVTMLCRFVGKLNNTTIPQAAKNISYYDDAALVAEWAAPYVDYAYNNNIMKGANGCFSPTGAFTVEQSLLTVARLVNANGWGV